MNQFISSSSSTHPSIFRYVGGKGRREIRELILGYAPPWYAEYREAFVGGGGIYFSVPRAKKRWINDADPDLMAVYLALRDRPDEFISACRSIQPARRGELAVLNSVGKPINLRLKEVFYRLLEDPEADRAVRFFFHNRTCHAGRVIYDRTKASGQLSYSNPSGWDIVLTDRLNRAAERVSGARMTIGSFEPLLFDPGDNVWVFLDPPYVMETLMPQTGKLYAHGFNMEDHCRLAEAFRRSPHAISITYDDHPLIRDLYADFNIREIGWYYTHSHKQGRELLITNYPLATVAAAA